MPATTITDVFEFTVQQIKHKNEIMCSTCASEQPITLAIKLLIYKKAKMLGNKFALTWTES